MTAASAAKLTSFLVYNPTYGPREGQEHLKVLYYHPESENSDVKVNNVGLCEALVQFAKTYSPDKPCESLHTQKHRQVFFEAEENFWFVMTVSNPWKETIVDGRVAREIYEERVKDIVLRAVLKRAYQMFKFFMGTLQDIVAQDGVEGLKKKLQDFYVKYLRDVDVHSSDILDVLNGVEYFPLDKTTFLRVQSFLNSLISPFPNVQYTMVMYSDKLVWSGLNAEDSRTLYSYLANKLLPSSSEFENSLISSYLTREGSYGRFLAGIRYYEHSTDRHTTTVFVNADTKPEKLYMVTYQVLSISITLLISGDAPPSVDTFRKLDAFMGKSLIDFSTVMEAVPLRSIDSVDTPYKFVYFHHGSLSVVSSCHQRDSGGFMKCTMPPDVMRVILTLCQEFTRKTSEVEVISKSSSDYWVVGRRSERHECYVVVNQRNANLIEINDEVKKICASHIPHITLAM